MLFLLSHDAFYAVAIERNDSRIVDWAKQTPAKDVFGSALSVGSLYDVIEVTDVLTPNQKEIARSKVAREALRLERSGRLYGLDIEISRQWADTIRLDLRELNGNTLPQDARLMLATALSKNLAYVGAYEEPSMSRLLQRGLYGFDPETNTSWP